MQFHPDAHPTLFDLTYVEDELKVLFQRDVDLVTRKGVTASRNYLRRNAILSSAQVIYGRQSFLIQSCNWQGDRIRSPSLAAANAKLYSAIAREQRRGFYHH